ncbi:CD209 antigen-like protein A isoform X1 [Centroberyx affinis]|uniref:CD209 antigen-like protein A isoform X1 n=1 Tax=Centroberyx affinis TaxID=166261 RepID=UPI003A5C10D3
MAVFFHSGESEIQVEVGDYQEFPKAEAEEAVSVRTPKSRESEIQVETGDYQEFPKTEAEEAVSVRTPKSRESEIHVEVGVYQNFPKAEAEEAVSVRTPKSKFRHLSVVLASFGLLCVLQAILNISLRLALNNNNLQSSYYDLAEERNNSQKKPCEETEEERCPHRWLTFGSSCYYTSSERRSWDQSRQACLQREADLVIINSREEQDFLSQFAVAAWVGMTDRDEEGIWKWVDGTPVISDRLQWAPGQPDDAFGGEDCGDIRVMLDFIGLNDYNCSAKNSWICEKTLS